MQQPFKEMRKQYIMKNNYSLTVKACSASYLVQGILNNFLPLLFLRFGIEFGLSYDKISFLIMINFGIQMVVDYLSAKLVDYFGYRKSAFASQLFSAVGLIGLAVLPGIMPDAYTGIVISVLIYAIGSGLIETVASPIVQACPIDNKDAIMSMLHSFYCWGHVVVVLMSSIYFALFGIESWRILACMWAIIPFVLMFIFLKVPMRSLAEEGRTMGGREMMKLPVFWILIVLMFCSGASEQGISQWVSTFAEGGLGIDKTLGDLIGTCMFAVLMGSARMFYARFSNKINLTRFMVISGMLAFVCYIAAALSPSPVISLMACVLCGTTVGIMWPGIYSISTGVIKGGGTGMFAYLALAGDLGCSGGPGLLGLVSDAFAGNLRYGILVAGIFPALFVIMLLLLKKKAGKEVELLEGNN